MDRCPPNFHNGRSTRTLFAHRLTLPAEAAMQIPGVHIETLANPCAYTYAQIEKACAIAQLLNRGRLVLTIPPPHDCEPSLNEDGVCHWCRLRPDA